VRPGLPAALDAVLDRALAKDPDARWATGAELAAAASAALGGVPPPPRAPSAAPRRRRALVGLAAVMALLVAAAGLLVLRRDHAPALAVPDADSVAVIDPGRPSLVADVAVGDSPAHVAPGFGSLWVTNVDSGTVSRIDLATRALRQTIPVGDGPDAIATGAGGVWVVNAVGGTVSWISPATNQVVEDIPASGAVGVCVAGGAVWIATANDRDLVRFDPARRTTTRVVLDDPPSQLACGGGSVWVSSEAAGNVTRVDAASRRVVRRIPAGGGASGLAFGQGALWVANRTDGTVSLIDPARGIQSGVITVGRRDGPASVAVGPAGVWVGNELAGTVARIDPDRGKVDRTLAIGNRPEGLAVSWEYNTSGILALANDGLVAFRRAGGQDGTTVVPDLATGLPALTDGGRTYTFQLRAGVRYSTGAPVKASDIRRGISRFLRKGAVPPTFYAGIRGAAACAAHPAHCGLSDGVVVDDAAGTITFHLTGPDPEFLYKLALTFAVAVPPGTGLAKLRRPVAATGPYMVTRIDRHDVRLVRNPRFRPTASRPAGYPDVITMTPAGGHAGLRAVEAGTADYINPALTPAEGHTLTTRYAGQLHGTLEPALVFAFLNTRLPPFDNVDARRALNYAVDRAAVARLEGGERFAQPTCQILPPNFPGYQPYCPYTLHPGSGRSWSAPDLARARRLVTRSGTRGRRVTVWGPKEGLDRETRYLARLLDRLGYRASARIVKGDYFGAVRDERNRAQIGTSYWGSDYPAAANFVENLFSCVASRVTADQLVDLSRYCAAGTDRLMRRAQRLELEDPPRADAAWARADRDLVDQAAALPLTTPRAGDVVSRRVGHFERSPQWGVLFDQLWVR
jgi:peptide/nickel transport system substrate-binding protein